MITFSWFPEWLHQLWCPYPRRVLFHSPNPSQYGKTFFCLSDSCQLSSPGRFICISWTIQMMSISSPICCLGINILPSYWGFASLSSTPRFLELQKTFPLLSQAGTQEKCFDFLATTWTVDGTEPILWLRAEEQLSLLQVVCVLSKM